MPDERLPDHYRLTVFFDADEESEAFDLARAVQRVVERLGWDADCVHLLREKSEWIGLYIPEADSGSPSTCGERWEDPFGEMNECGKPLGHGGPHLATWAMRLDAKNGSERA